MEQEKRQDRSKTETIEAFHPVQGRQRWYVCTRREFQNLSQQSQKTSVSEH